jgi:hypothetical protein
MDHLFEAIPSTPLQRLAAAWAVGLTLFVWTTVVPAARTFPPDVTFAKGAIFDYPFLQMGSKTLRLAVGSRIYDQNNRILVPASAPAAANVLYKTDSNGEIFKVWILTDQETQAFIKKPFSTKKY